MIILRRPRLGVRALGEDVMADSVLWGERERL